jgi:hypothetical protein
MGDNLLMAQHFQCSNVAVLERLRADSIHMRVTSALALFMLTVSSAAVASKAPDILFIVIDDTRMDQWARFGWDANGVQRAPDTPVLDAITSGSVATGSVDYPVNSVDLFALFAEVASVDLDAVMHASHVRDAKSMMPYLKNPDAPAVRAFYLAQCGTSVFNSFDPPQACTFPVAGGLCDDIHFTAENLCLANGGVWHGVDSLDPSFFVSCSNVYLDPRADWDSDFPPPSPERQFAISMMDDTSAVYRMWKLIVFEPAWRYRNECVDQIEFYPLP